MCDEQLDEPITAPVRCKRCGCWLNTKNPDGEYCSPCLTAMAIRSRACLACGEPFMPGKSGKVRCPECEEKYQRRKRICPICGDDFLPYACTACTDRYEHRIVCHRCHWRMVHAEAAEMREKTCRICGCSFLPRRCTREGCEAHLKEICPMCHENIDHSEARVWSLPKCERCEKAKAVLAASGHQVIEFNLESLVSGEEPDAGAMSSLAMNEQVAPVIRMNGRFLCITEIDALIA